MSTLTLTAALVLYNESLDIEAQPIWLSCLPIILEHCAFMSLWLSSEVSSPSF